MPNELVNSRGLWEVDSQARPKCTQILSADSRAPLVFGTTAHLDMIWGDVARLVSVIGGGWGNR